MSAGSHASAPYYFVPPPSQWPLVGSFAMAFAGFGAVGTVNSAAWGPWSLLVGFAILFYMLLGWFGQVAGESEGGQYNALVDSSFRWSMSWFIFSEVMFFGAFFGALFYARSITMPWLGDLDHKQFAVTVILGAVFMGFQAYEYAHAYADLNLKLTSGIFGSTFFLLTGFHGFHVTIGAIMLFVVLIRVLKGHFTPEHHFAFEGAAWYWHFVDVVWLGLYVIVYWL